MRLWQAFLWIGLSGAALASPQNFKLGINYSELLPISPLVVNYSTATADSQGNVYILYSSPDASSLITKVSAAGDHIFYQTPLPFGRTNFIAIAADNAGNVYISTSTFVEKLAPDGATMLYKTVLATDNNPDDSLFVTAMALDTSGRVYLTGTVPSGGLTTTPGAFQPTSPSNPHLYENFVIRLKTNGAVDYATYLGDSAQVGGAAGIAAADGSAFVTGLALADFPTTPGAYLPASAIATIYGVPFVARLSPDGSKLVYATVTGSQTAYPEGFTIDSTGDATVLIAGLAQYQILRLNPQGTALLFSSAPPISAIPSGPGTLAVDAAGNTYLLLQAEFNYVVQNSLATCPNPSGTNALTVLDGSGNMLQSTYVAGSALTIFPGAHSTMYILGAPDASYVPTMQMLPVSSGGAVYLTSLSPNPNAPVVQLACVSNAAFYGGSAGVAPGELVSLFGQGLGPATGTLPQLQGQARFPKQLAGVKVTFNGTPGPLLYVQDGQINAIAPFSLGSGQTVNICVVYNGAATNCIVNPLVAANPGVFTNPSDSAYAWNPDGTVNSPSHPAPAGSIMSVYATGLGSITPAQPDGAFIGFPLPSDNVPVTMSASTLCGGPGLPTPCSMPVNVLYAGPAPFEVAGVSQINFVATAGIYHLSAATGTCSFEIYQ